MRAVAYLAAGLVFGTCHTVLAEPCGNYVFPERTDDVRYDSVTRSLAKVYKTEKPSSSDYLGTASLIDLKRGLLITAAHVVKHKSVFVTFPRSSENSVWKAERVVEVAEADGRAESNGSAWKDVRDIALLKLAEEQKYLVALEMWIGEEPNLSARVWFYGFPGDTSTAMPGDGSFVIPKGESRCTRLLRENIKYGDSGSPVVNRAGMLVGVLIQQHDRNRTGTYVPTRCIAPVVMQYLGESFQRQAFDRLRTSGRRAVVHMLKPPKVDDDWMSNIELSAAIEWASDTSTRARKLKEHHKCPIGPAIISRGLGLPLYDRYVSARSDHVNWHKDEGDALTKRGKQLEAEGRDAEALMTLRAAESAYGRFIDGVLAHKDKLIRSRLVSQAYRGITDSKIRRALLDVGSRENLLLEAQYAAAAAALYADDEEDAGAALASLGVAAQRREDYQTAVEAYSAAVQQGFKRNWVDGSYKLAFKMRDNVKNANFASDYKRLGLYTALEKKRVSDYAAKAVR